MDHLAHLAWWRDRTARLVEAVRTGGEPPPPLTPGLARTRLNTLACFYGLTGRVAPALPLLRAALNGAPELLELARKDPDLDRIRSADEVASLLGG